MKDFIEFTQLSEAQTADQKRYLKREYDLNPIPSADERLLLTVANGKTDKYGIPDFSGVTLCDLVKLPLDAFIKMLSLAPDQRGGDKMQFSRVIQNLMTWNVGAYPLKGRDRLNDLLDKVCSTLGEAYGDEAMGGSKARIAELYKQILACPNRADWTKHPGGVLYRGKSMSWDKLVAMRWKRVGDRLEADGVYQSRLAAQSWSTSITIAKEFARGMGGSEEPGLDVNVSWNYEKVGKISGRLPVIIQANIPGKQCIFNPAASYRLGKFTADLDAKEWEVVRVSQDPVKAKFIILIKDLKDYSGYRAVSGVIDDIINRLTSGKSK